MPRTADEDLDYLRDSFHQVCSEAKTAGLWYVVLFENRPFYGGPEEGGWWGNDRILVAYQCYDTEEMAEAAKDKVMELAADLTAESRRAEGELCLHQMEFLDARGLDADFLPENDGESEFYVTVMERVPESAYGCRHYS